MKVFHLRSLRPEPADVAHFTGRAAVTRMMGAADKPLVNLYRVEFQPGARTHWHSHSGPQLLLILEGQCRFQRWGDAVQQVESGDTIAIAPGEKHWHGASPDGRMIHLAINVDAATTWMEPVSDDQYARF